MAGVMLHHRMINKFLPMFNRTGDNRNTGNDQEILTMVLLEIVVGTQVTDKKVNSGQRYLYLII